MVVEGVGVGGGVKRGAVIVVGLVLDVREAVWGGWEGGEGG